MRMNKTGTLYEDIASGTQPFSVHASTIRKTYLKGILRYRSIFPFGYLDKIDVSLFHSVRTGSGIRFSCSMGTGVSFPGTKAAGA